jgi:hypothetical protein
VQSRFAAHAPNPASCRSCQEKRQEHISNIFQQVNRELAFWACSQHLTGPFRMQIHDSCDDKQKKAANP